MVTLATVAALVVAGLASLFMAWAIGAGSSGSTPFAPAVGANAISVMRAGFVVGILGLLGAILQGANVTEAVGRELVLNVTLTPSAAVVGLVTAAGLVAVGVFAGYPIATAFTVTGAVVGVGLALGGAPAWAKYYEILALWVATPFLGGGAAYLTAGTLRDDRIPERLSVPVLGALVGLIVANVSIGPLGPSPAGVSLSTAGAATVLDVTGHPSIPGGGATVSAALSLAFATGVAILIARDFARDETGAQRRFLLVLGGLVAFSAGGSQVGLALGPMLALLDDVELAVPLMGILLFGGVGLLLGSWTGAPRMIKALSQDYSSLGPRRSIAALIPSFIIAQTAVFLGVPVSFNEIVVSAIIGAGYAAGGAGVSTRKMVYTAVAWIGSLLLAGVLGYGGFLAVQVLR